MSIFILHRHISISPLTLPYDDRSSQAMAGDLKKDAGFGLALVWASGKLNFPLNPTDKDALSLVLAASASHYNCQKNATGTLLHAGVLGSTLGMKSIESLYSHKSRWPSASGFQDELWSSILNTVTTNPGRKLMLLLQFRPKSQGIEHGFGVEFANGRYTVVDTSMGGKPPIWTDVTEFRRHCDAVLSRFHSDGGYNELIVNEFTILLPQHKTDADRKITGWVSCENPELDALIAALEHEDAHAGTH